jgi:hypothetical protein
VSAGDLTPSEAADLFKLVDGFTRTLEATVFEERVARLDLPQGLPKKIEFQLLLADLTL